MRRTENKPFGRTHQLRVANSPVPCQLFLTSPDFFSGFWFLSSLLLSGLVSFLLSLNSLYLFSSHCTLLVAGYSEHLLHCNFCTETFQKLFRTFCPGSAASWQIIRNGFCVCCYLWRAIRGPSQWILLRWLHDVQRKRPGCPIGCWEIGCSDEWRTLAAKLLISLSLSLLIFFRRGQSDWSPSVLTCQKMQI